MKKIYRIPTMELVELETTPLLGNSGGVSGNNGSGYGGIDHNGTHDPAAPHHHYKEDEEDEEEEDW